MKDFLIKKIAKTPLSATDLYQSLSKISQYNKNSFLLESSDKAGEKSRYSALGLCPDKIWELKDYQITISSTTEKRTFLRNSFVEIKQDLEGFIKSSSLNNEDLPPIFSGVFGFMSYDMVHYFENIKAHIVDDINIPEAFFIRPTILLIIDNITDELSISIPLWEGSQKKEKELLLEEIYKQILQAKITKKNSPTIKGKINFKEHTNKEAYASMIKKSKKYITEGDIFQIVPSRRFSCDFTYSGFSLYEELREINPSPFLYYFNLEAQNNNKFEIIGASPEIMTKVADGEVTIRPLAGTRKRGANKEEDVALAKDLLNDKKEIAEHLMLIDLGRNDVGRVAKENSVEVTHYMDIEYYSHVMHISSTIKGNMKNDKTRLDALIAGFPVGTVSGAPKIRAMEIISELESEARSFYAGCAGYFSSHSKYMDMAIMIRTALLKNNILYAQAGGGIVYDSQEAAEIQETENKAGAIFSAANKVAEKN